jgi:hypothetical protein
LTDAIGTMVRRFARRIVLGLVSLAIFVALAEGGSALVLRITDLEWTEPVASGQPYLVYDVVRVWKLRRSYDDGMIRINSVGFRGPEVSMPKEPGRTRILALGDSITFGTYDCPSDQCPEQDTYPAQLQRALEIAGAPAEVLNAGTQGYNSEKDLIWYREELAALRPDVVLVLVGWNDALESSSVNPASVRRGRFAGNAVLTWVDDVLRYHSNSYRLVWLIAKRFTGATEVATALTAPDQEPPAHITVDPDKIGQYSEHLHEIARRARGQGARVVLMTLPGAIGDDPGQLAPQDQAAIRRRYQWPDLGLLAREVARYNDVVRDVASSEGASFIDLAQVVRDLGGASLYRLPDMNHPTHDSVGSIAQEIARRLRSEGLVAAP